MSDNQNPFGKKSAKTTLKSLGAVRLSEAKAATGRVSAFGKSGAPTSLVQAVQAAKMDFPIEEGDDRPMTEADKDYIDFSYNAKKKDAFEEIMEKAILGGSKSQKSFKPQERAAFEAKMEKAFKCAQDLKRGRKMAKASKSDSDSQNPFK